MSIATGSTRYLMFAHLPVGPTALVTRNELAATVRTHAGHLWRRGSNENAQAAGVFDVVPGETWAKPVASVVSDGLGQA